MSRPPAWARRRSTASTAKPGRPSGVNLVKAGDSAEDAAAQGTEAGREALIKTVADLTGVTVDHYAEIGLLGFALITDALGGVNVCLKDAVYEPLSGADFPAGPQKLDGPEALSFVRQRHDLPRGDLDRVVRQQVVMASLAHRVISGKTLSSPTTLKRLEAAVQRSVVSPRAGTSWISSSSCRSWPAATSRSPPSRCSTGPAGATTACKAWSGWTRTRCRTGSPACCNEQDEGKTEQLAYTPAKTTATVVNDTDINGLAAAVSDVLSAKGFTTGAVGNSDGTHVKTSQVRAAKPDDLGAQEVSKELGGLPVVADSSLAAGTVRVVLANDYTGPGSGLSGSGSDRARPGGECRVGRRRRPECPCAVADPDRRHRQAGVHQLSHCSAGRSWIRCCGPTRSVRASPTTTTPPANASNCPR